MNDDEDALLIFSPLPSLTLSPPAPLLHLFPLFLLVSFPLSALGGTIVTAYGLWLGLTTPTAYCHFGLTIVPAMVYNATTLSCIAPGLGLGLGGDNTVSVSSSDPSLMVGGGGGVVSFGVSLDGQLITITTTTTNNNTSNSINPLSSSLSTPSFTYLPPGVITGVGPLQGTTSGTSLVEITGYGFDIKSTTLTSCRFDTDSPVASPMLFLSATKLACYAPPHVAGQVSLTIALGPYYYRNPDASLGISLDTSASTGADPSLSSSSSPSPNLPASGVIELSFHYADPQDLALVPVVTTLTPSAALTGGQGLGGKGMVVVTGSGFLPTSIDASNSNTSTPISTTTSTSTCWFGHSSVPALVLSSTQLSCPCPLAVRPGTVDFTVMIGGVRSQAGLLNFTYLAPVLVRAVWPLSGGVAGGTSLVVYGGGFHSVTDRMECLFYPSSVNDSTTSIPARTPARVINNTAIACETPPRYTSAHSNSTTL